MQHTDFCFERNEYTFIQQGCFKISKSDGNDIYNVANEKILFMKESRNTYQFPQKY